MKNPFKFEPKPISILIAIASTVAVAGATIYIGLILLWIFGRFPPDLTTPRAPLNTITSVAIPAFIASTAMAMLWRHSGQAAPNAPKNLRATYTVGVGLIIAWWLGLLVFGATYLLG